MRSRSRTHLKFRKSSYSGARTEGCVEVADLPDGAAVRDTQNRNLGHIGFGGTEWQAFLRSVKNRAL
ncbi:DUF397 domain-containing protein [Nocardiopsis potens]|uniref:DUF397 domain-containing protein n=1 Tax=Nocardiopsis potens TaxID=1246458 RepID=UPI00034B21D7|nr:DUF397 domain-containing protein [Nocardiopsis potens]